MDKSAWSLSAIGYRLAAATRLPVVRQLASGVAWNVGAVAVERLIALLQAVYVARLLGIVEFGKYGLLFVTVGLMSSIIGLQLGLTSSVNIARANRSDPQHAAAVMRVCELVSVGLGCIGLLLVLLAPGTAAQYLLGDPAQSGIVIVAGVIAAVAVLSGVQEGVLQGLEQFRRLAILRSGCSVLSFGLLLLLAKKGDLASVITALLLGITIRAVLLFIVKEAAARKRKLAAKWKSIYGARHILFSFSFPAVLSTLVSGSAHWLGFFLVSSSPGGFKDVAAMTAGQQWRGLALYVATISASVAIPMMSRLSGTGDLGGVRQIHRVSLLVSISAVLMFVAGIWLLADYVLVLYGSKFTDGRYAFVAMVATTIPLVWMNVFMQYLVSQGRMWEQLAYYFIQAVLLAIGYFLLANPYGATGVGIWTVVIGLMICLFMTFRLQVGIAAPAVSQVEKSTTQNV